jgi:hypothetical protein
MYLVMIAWSYVVLMMAAAEATNSNGSLLGAGITLVFYGALPLAIVMYLLNTPARRKAARAKRIAVAGSSVASPAPLDPDQRGHAAGDAVPAVREEP